MKLFCKICNKECKSLQILSLHINTHNIEKSEYYLKYINNNNCCKVCGKETKFLDLKRGFKSICENKECFLSYTNPRRLSFWLLRGYSENDAKKQVFNVQSKSVKNRTKESYTGIHNSLTLEYYLNKNYTKEEALLKIKERQTLTSLDSFIKRYGKEIGVLKYNERLDKIKNAYLNKSESEMQKINSSKGKSFDYLCNKYGNDKAKDIIKKRTKITFNSVNSKFTSKLETEIFLTLKKIFPQLQQQLILYNDKKIYYYDMYIGNVIIEINGTYWHADPRKYNKDDIIGRGNTKYTAKEIWERDKFKHFFAENNYYKIFYIWELDYNKDKTKVINDIIKNIYAFMNN